VPGCGPGEEVLLLAERFPGRQIVATDPSAGMLGIVWSALRARGVAHVVASAGGAETLSAFVRQAAGVLSCFSLQLLPNPLAALADWSRALRPGGRIAALFGPRKPDDSAVGRLHRAIETVTGERRAEWEDIALEALPRIGLRLVSDRTVAHAMVHASADEYFDELVLSGPLQALEMSAGPDAVARSRAAWLEGGTSAARPWKHEPPARLWELERLEGFEPDHH
jgi:ubiquinone/menaquinone biosynthesis C-methylase UbiE